MAGTAGSPSTTGDIIEQLEDGALTPAEAIAIFRGMEVKPRTVPPLRIVSSEFVEEKEEDALKQQRLAQAMADLDALIGLDSVKKLVREVQAFVLIQQRRSRARLATEPLALHMIFKGNPGTGKTTVARIFGRMFEAMGVLPKGHLIECERADIVGEYIGHTAQKTRDKMKQAMGGILFIDEAYALARGGEKDFGKEAIDTLVKAMEDHKERMVLILAGYCQEMDDFLECNPGLRSRFPIHIDFQDYRIDDLLKIAHLMLSQREYRLTEAAKRRLKTVLTHTLRTPHPHLGNARLVRNMIERAIRRQAVRLVSREQLSRTELLLITEADIEEEAE